MPTYTFRRDDGTTLKQRLTFAQYEQVRTGAFNLLDEDGAALQLVFDPSDTSFILKDGPSGGWASKALKENKYRNSRSSVMAKREKDHVFKTKLVPNYNGQEAATWQEARDEARVQKGEAAALTYEPLVAQEKAKK